MARVAVFGEMTGDNRTVSVGGRSKNKGIKAWINFDYFKTQKRESKRSPKGYVEEKIDSGTNSVTTDVWRNEEGKVFVYFTTDKFKAGDNEQVEVYVNGIRLDELMEVYNKNK